MAKKEELNLDLDDVLKSAKKFVKAGKLDELAEAWVENKEEAENPNALVDFLGQVGEFIQENDIEEKLEDLLSEEKKTTKKKSTAKKKTSATKKTATKKKSTKKTTSTTKKTTTKKKSTAKKTTSATKKTTTKKKTTAKKTTKKSS